MALSPPGANSVTIAVIVPPAAVPTTEYCASAASVETLHGSTRAPEPGVSATVVVVTSVPSLKRNHWSGALVAVTLWRRIGVVKPTPFAGVGQEDSDWGMFGRKHCVSGAPGAEYAGRVVLRVDDDRERLRAGDGDRVLLAVEEPGCAKREVVRVRIDGLRATGVDRARDDDRTGASVEGTERRGRGRRARAEVLDDERRHEAEEATGDVRQVDGGRAGGEAVVRHGLGAVAGALVLVHDADDRRAEA